MSAFIVEIKEIKIVSMRNS